MYFTFESVEIKVSNCQTLYFIGKCSSHESRKSQPVLMKLSKDQTAGMEQSRSWQVSPCGQVLLISEVFIKNTGSRSILGKRIKAAPWPVVTRSRTMVLNSNCMLKSPGELLKIPTTVRTPDQLNKNPQEWSQGWVGTRDSSFLKNSRSDNIQSVLLLNHPSIYKKYRR